MKIVISDTSPYFLDLDAPTLSACQAQIQGSLSLQHQLHHPIQVVTRDRLLEVDSNPDQSLRDTSFWRFRNNALFRQEFMQAGILAH